MDRQLLHRFWFEFERAAAPPGARLGCGVTAYGEEDARSLLAQAVFGGAGLPALRRLVEDVDVSTLDPGHVLPNMSDPTRRGVWFPAGHR